MRVGKRCAGGVSSLQPSWARVVWLPGQMMSTCSSRHLPVWLDMAAAKCGGCDLTYERCLGKCAACTVVYFPVEFACLTRVSD